VRTRVRGRTARLGLVSFRWLPLRVPGCALSTLPLHGLGRACSACVRPTAALFGGQHTYLPAIVLLCMGLDVTVARGWMCAGRRDGWLPGYMTRLGQASRAPGGFWYASQPTAPPSWGQPACQQSSY